MYLVSRHEDLMTVLRDPSSSLRSWATTKQMAHGHLDEMKDILSVREAGSFPMSPTSIPRGTPACAACCRRPSAGGV